MHGDDVASAGTQLATQTVSEIIQLIIKIAQAKAEEHRQNKMLENQMKSNQPFELHGEQKLLSDLKKGGELTSVKLTKEDFEAFKKINKNELGNEIAFHAIQTNPDSEYVDLHFLKSDQKMVENVCSEIVEQKLADPEQSYKMTMIPKEKAAAFQEVCAENNIPVTMTESKDGEIRCTYRADNELKVQKALENTDELHNSLDKVSVEIKTENGKPKITINDVEQNKSINMRFGDRQKFERVLQEQFGFSKAKATAASSVLNAKLTTDQKRYFNSGNKLLEQVDKLDHDIKFEKDSILVQDFKFTKIKLKDSPEELLSITDKDGNTAFLNGKDKSRKAVEEILKRDLKTESKEQLNDLLNKTEHIGYADKAVSKTVGEYSIKRTSQGIAEISTDDKSVMIDLSKRDSAKALMKSEFGMSDKKAERIFDKAKKQSVTKTILSRAKANSPKPDTMIKDKKPTRGSRK